MELERNEVTRSPPSPWAKAGDPSKNVEINAANTRSNTRAANRRPVVRIRNIGVLLAGAKWDSAGVEKAGAGSATGRRHLLRENPAPGLSDQRSISVSQ